MKKLFLLSLFFTLLIGANLPAQELTPVLTHEMSPEEMLRKHEIGRDFTPTEPPVAPVRPVGEFEQMQSVLVRYPFGIPMSLIVEMSQDCKVKTIVASVGEQQTVTSQYESAGVNMANCEWLIAPSNSYWTRDYGPWWAVDGNDNVGIVDFPYNRPRPNDDNIPVVLAQQMGVPLWGMDLIHTGGNWMDDGLGIASSTTLTQTENPDLTEEEIDALVADYLGVNKYMLIDDPLDDYIEHIDCWGKFLDVDKVLIGQVPQSDYRYADYEYVANYFSFQTTSWGNKYQVYRVYTPGTYPYTPYTNSLILNKKVFVPITGSQYDDEALAVYEEAMPGYEIIGVMHSNWENTDALHCRAKGIADVEMLYISHMPLLGEKDFQTQWDLDAWITPYSGLSVKTDSTRYYYKVDDGEYQSLPLQLVSGRQYRATIPFILPGSQVSYYLHSADFSGRSANHPYIGSPDPHVFTVDYADDAIVSPDTLIYLTVDEMLYGKEFQIYNYTDANLTITEIENEGFGWFHWYIDPAMEVPVEIASIDTLTVNVKIDIPLDEYLGYLVTDTLDFQTQYGHHQVILKVDSDLLSGLPGQPALSNAIIGSVAPNPFSNETRISLSLKDDGKVGLSVITLQGQAIRSLVSQDLAAGNHEITWNGLDDAGNKVSAGIYLLKLETETGVDFRKIVIAY